MADILISLLAVYLIASLPCAIAIGCLLRNSQPDYGDSRAP